MFTIEQIKSAHAKVNSGADFPQYIRDLKSLGVLSYETHVSDGRTSYQGSNKYFLSGEARYAPLAVIPKSNTGVFKQRLKAHQEGQTDFMTFCNDAANAGVEKWRVDLHAMTCTYYDMTGVTMVTESIPDK